MRHLEADLVLLATGRVPRAEDLDSARAGFDLHDDRRLAVDEHQRVLSGGSPVPGVWALGDISSARRLKHVANAEARVVAHNLLIQPLIQAMAFGLDAATMARGQYWIHPALTEVVENALLGLDLAGPVRRV
ncbi:MAG: mycothione reductase [Micrococcaceae bacterium]|nr:mycothione reductase [Micrococcaceae bacterium]